MAILFLHSQGRVVQSIVSLTMSLKVNLLHVNVDYIAKYIVLLC